MCGSLTYPPHMKPPFTIRKEHHKIHKINLSINVLFTKDDIKKYIILCRVTVYIVREIIFNFPKNIQSLPKKKYEKRYHLLLIKKKHNQKNKNEKMKEQEQKHKMKQFHCSFNLIEEKTGKFLLIKETNSFFY